MSLFSTTPKRFSIYLDYGMSRTPVPFGKPHTFRWAYKTAVLGDNVYTLGTCLRHTRAECVDQLRKEFAKFGYEAVIVPSVEGIR